MSSTQVEDPICITCRGPKSTHFDDQGNPTTQHQFTTEEGTDLDTRAQRAKKEAKEKAAQRSPTLSGMTAMALGANPLAIGRLVELLLEKQVLSPEEGLYVAGMGQKPQVEVDGD